MHLKALLFCAGALIAPLSTSVAQRAPSNTGGLPLTRGTRVRVKSSELVTPVVANFLEVRADTIVLFEEGSGRGIWSFAFDQIQRLEMSVGERNMYGPYIARGALFGAGAGIIAGAIFAATLSPSDPTKKYDRVLTASVGGVLGAGIGAFVGSRQLAEKFKPIPIPRRMSVLPDRHGARFVVGF